jgi:hypothetical protein
MEKSINKIIGEYVERKDIGGLAEYFRAYIEDEITPLNDPKINGVDYENPPQSTEMEEWKKELVSILPLQHATLEVHNILFKFINKTLSSHSQKLKEKIMELEEAVPYIAPEESEVYMYSLAQFNRVAGRNKAIEDVINIINQVK